MEKEKITNVITPYSIARRLRRFHSEAEKELLNSFNLQKLNEQ